MHFRTSFPVPSLKQLSARFLPHQTEELQDPTHLIFVTVAALSAEGCCWNIEWVAPTQWQNRLKHFLARFTDGAKILPKEKEQEMMSTKCITLRNVLDCYVKSLLGLVGIDAQAPYFSCQIQWTQSSFPQYNQLSAWLISLRMSAWLLVVSEYLNPRKNSYQLYSQL